MPRVRVGAWRNSVHVYLIVGLIVSTALLGGSSRPDAASILMLRPVVVLLIGGLLLVDGPFDRAAVRLPLIALGLLFWILRRHQKHKARNTPSANPDVFFPPDPPQTQPKAELDSQQTTYGEKYQHDVPGELEGPPVLVNPAASPEPVAQTASYDPRTYRVSSLSPLEAATDVSRWSDISSMGPPSNRASAGAGGLLAVSQQHYGGGGQPQQQQYQPYRPPSGLPAPAELE